MQLTKLKLAQMIDISAVRADSTAQEVRAIVQAARENRFIAIFAMPSFTSYAKELLGAEPGILLGGTVGFPSGAHTTSCKAFEADELLSIGCNELDMVINIGKLKSRLYSEVEADIRKIVDLANPKPVKVILEVSLLDEHEICEGAKIVRDQGARFVKTGTGWSTATSLEHIAMIQKAVGESIEIKVAGGVRDLETLTTMYDMGVTRFGIGHKAAHRILEQFDAKYGG